MKIGVFDSGLGGLSVAKVLEKAFPEDEIVFRHDAAHFPYGSKSPQVILGYVEPIIQGLVAEGCAVIVIACNTVSTTLIGELRQRVARHLVAIEPMVKPASELTMSKVIAVCATPTTLASERYKWLKQEYTETAGIKVLEPDCSSWARMIQDKKFDAAVIADEITDVLELGADVIVLACTHFSWIRDDILSLVKDRAIVVTQEDAIIEEVKLQLTAVVEQA